MAFADPNREREYKRGYQRQWRAAHPARARELLRESRWRLRLETLAQYGGACACCEEDREPFLAIDHINGVKPEGAPRGSPGLYIWLRENGWPKGFQVLCHNCNMAVTHDRVCPHQAVR